jgi:hypothetical protein
MEDVIHDGQNLPDDEQYYRVSITSCDETYTIVAQSDDVYALIMCDSLAIGGNGAAVGINKPADVVFNSVTCLMELEYMDFRKYEDVAGQYDEVQITFIKA